MEFPFEKLQVYQQAQGFNLDVQRLVSRNRLSRHPVFDQISRAALSVPLNIAEAHGRWTGPDRRRIYRIALGSNFECIPLLDVLLQNQFIEVSAHLESRAKLASVARMLTTLINQS